MDIKSEEFKNGQSGDELIGQMLTDICSGFKDKMIRPVLDENRKISSQLQALMAQEQSEMLALKEKIAQLDARLQQIPLIILASFRDAINQAGRDIQDDRE